MSYQTTDFLYEELQRLESKESKTDEDNARIYEIEEIISARFQ